MKERPILFSGPMVRAILDGSKTMTRRVVKPQPPNEATHMIQDCDGCLWMRKNVGEGTSSPVGIYFKPPYLTGHILYVKESAWMWCERRPNGKTKTGRTKWKYVALPSAPIWFLADEREKPDVDVVSPDTGNKWMWKFKAARYMTRTASRLWLQVYSLRVERLQDISEEDAKAEGCRYPLSGPNSCYRMAFQTLWESIHGKGSWSINPWVWVVNFKKI